MRDFEIAFVLGCLAAFFIVAALLDIAVDLGLLGG